MLKVIVSAPGKVIIHGEHAVVFGKRALAGSIGLRTELILQYTDSNDVAVNLPDVGVKLRWDCSELHSAFTLPLCDATSPAEISSDVLVLLKKFAGIDESVTDTKKLGVVALLYLLCSISLVKGTVPSVRIDVSSKLPTGAGLGSSAAFSTCLAASFLVSSNLIPGRRTLSCYVEGNGPLQLTADDKELINHWAFMAEKVIHGRPSGIDNSTSTYGGALSFEAGKITPLEMMPQFRIILVNTGVGRSTKQLVENVRLKHDRFPDVIKPVLNSIDAITRQCESTLVTLCGQQEENEELFKTLEELIDINRHHLEVLGVGHSSLDVVYSIATRHGLHAKLTGAGGGGCAFALVPPYISNDALSAVIADMSTAGFNCSVTSLGVPGVDVSLTKGDIMMSEAGRQPEELTSSNTR